VVRALALVWISHLHADHHLGLVRLLELRSARPGAAPLLVVGPHALGVWLREAAARLHSPVEFRFVHCGAAGADAAVCAAIRRLGCSWLASTRVDHCADSWGVALQHSEGWGLVYSGDTRPCERLVQLGKTLLPGCRILVHEATFDDTEGMAAEAEARRHSTVGEALDVGARMGAWRVLLTHFSQRYPKLTDVGGGLPAAGAILAFDLMSVPFRLLPALPRLTPALLCLFADELASAGDATDATVGASVDREVDAPVAAGDSGAPPSTV